MASREEVVEFLEERLPLPAGPFPRIRSILDWDLRKQLGLDDARLTEIAADADRRFLVTLDRSSVLKAKTVNDLVDVIHAATRDPVAAARPRKRTARKKPPAPPPAEEEGSSTEVMKEYTVWYGTNRKRIGDGNAVSYSAERGDTTSLGECRVFIPESHKMGSTGSSFLKRLLSGDDDRLRIIETKLVEEDDYWAAIKARLATLEAGERTAVVFIHGYNVSFEAAAIRAAQIGFDLSIKGAMAFFSWPSRGALSGYLPDGEAIEASETAMADFLIDFASRSEAASVHVIAHSMGNRGLLRAVNRIVARAGQAGTTLFSQIVLAAPDVDAGVFRELCSAYSQVAQRTTLYVSRKDLAVEASGHLHDFARAGFSPPVLVMPGIDTVNVTNVDVSRLGHGYVAEARDVIMDMYRLFSDGAAPEKRNLAQLQNETGSVYWEFRK